MVAGIEIDPTHRAFHPKWNYSYKRQLALIPSSDPSPAGVIYAGPALSDNKVAKVRVSHDTADPREVRELLRQIPWEALIGTEASVIQPVEKGPWKCLHLHAPLEWLRQIKSRTVKFYLSIGHYATTAGWKGCEITMLTSIYGVQKGKGPIVPEVLVLDKIYAVGNAYHNRDSAKMRQLTQEFWVGDRSITKALAESLQLGHPLLWVPGIRMGAHLVRPILKNITCVRKVSDLAPRGPIVCPEVVLTCQDLFVPFEVPKAVKNQELTRGKLATKDGFRDLTRLAYAPSQHVANAAKRSVIDVRDIMLEWRYWRSFRWAAKLHTRPSTERTAIFAAMAAMCFQFAVTKLTKLMSSTRNQRSPWTNSVNIIRSECFGYLTFHVTIPRDNKITWSSCTPTRLYFDEPRLELASTITTVQPVNSGTQQVIGITVLTKETAQYLKRHSQMKLSKLAFQASAQFWESRDKQTFTRLAYALLNPERSDADLMIMKLLLPNQQKLVSKVKVTTSDQGEYKYPEVVSEDLDDKQESVLRALQANQGFATAQSPAGSGKTKMSLQAVDQHLDSGQERHEAEPLATKVLLTASDNSATDHLSAEYDRCLRSGKHPKPWSHYKMKAASKRVEQSERARTRQSVQGCRLDRSDPVPEQWLDNVASNLEEREALTAGEDQEIRNRHQVVSATTFTALTKLRDTRFSMLVIDESTKISTLELCELLCLMNHDDNIKRRCNVLLLGDQRQLGKPILGMTPIRRAMEAITNESGLERMSAVLPAEQKIALSHVYRVSMEHTQLVKDLIYNKQLSASPTPNTWEDYMRNKPPGFPLPYRVKPDKSKVYAPAIYWVDVETKQVTSTARDKSLRRCTQTREQFSKFIRAWHHAGGPNTFDGLRVLTFYNDFRADLEDETMKLKQKLGCDMPNLINHVTTVDIAQGSQVPDVVLVPGFTANTRYQQLAHLTDVRQLCVALTRHQRSIIILADFEPIFMLSETTTHWRQLFKMVLDSGAVIMRTRRVERAQKLLGRQTWDPCVAASNPKDFFDMSNREVKLTKV